MAGPTMVVTRGRTSPFRIPVKDRAGTMYVLGDGEFLRFGVKRSTKDEEYLIYKEIREGTDGVYTLILKPEDTIYMEAGRYVYDVGLQSGDDYLDIIKTSAFTVSGNVTTPFMRDRIDEEEVAQNG